MLKFLEDKTLAESMCGIIIVFLIIAICITLLYYGACGLLYTSPSGSDVANIFVASATLLGPIILVFTLNAWKDQHNKNLSKEVALVCWDAVTLNTKLLQDIVTTHQRISSNNRNSPIIEKSTKADELEKELKNLQKSYNSANYDAIVQALKVRAICHKNLNTDEYIESINKANEELKELEKPFIFNLPHAKSLEGKMVEASNKLLTELENTIKA